MSRSKVCSKVASIIYIDRRSVSNPTTKPRHFFLYPGPPLTAQRIYRIIPDWFLVLAPPFETATESTMTDLTRRLPVELLAEILGHASPLDVLRFKQVKRPLFILMGVSTECKLS